MTRAISQSLAETPPAPAHVAAAAPNFRDMFAGHAPYVLGLLRRLGVREAEVEDVAQEVFVVVHRQLPAFEGRSTIKTWLCGIALRTAANHRRKHARRRESAMPTEIELCVAPTQEAELERKHLADDLLAALDALSPPLRAVFVLYEIEELPMLDVARALGCPRFTAYTRLRAARAQLRKAIARASLRNNKEGALP